MWLISAQAAVSIRAQCKLMRTADDCRQINPNLEKNMANDGLYRAGWIGGGGEAVFCGVFWNLACDMHRDRLQGQWVGTPMPRCLVFKRKNAMLVLSRRVGEEIVLPTLGVTITVLKKNRNQVRLGIQAPRELRVARGEIATALKKRLQGSNHGNTVTGLHYQSGMNDDAKIDSANLWVT